VCHAIVVPLAHLACFVLLKTVSSVSTTIAWVRANQRYPLKSTSVLSRKRTERLMTSQSVDQSLFAIADCRERCGPYCPLRRGMANWRRGGIHGSRRQPIPPTSNETSIGWVLVHLTPLRQVQSNGTEFSSMHVSDPGLGYCIRPCKDEALRISLDETLTFYSIVHTASVRRRVNMCYESLSNMEDPAQDSYWDCSSFGQLRRINNGKERDTGNSTGEWRLQGLLWTCEQWLAAVTDEFRLLLRRTLSLHVCACRYFGKFLHQAAHRVSILYTLQIWLWRSCREEDRSAGNQTHV
jgi:hypothetical protein